MAAVVLSRRDAEIAEASCDPELHELVQRVVASVRAVLGDALTAWFATRPDLAPDGPEEAARRLVPVVMALAQWFVMQRNLIDDFDEAGFLAAAAALLPS